MSSNGKYLIITPSEGSKDVLYFADLEKIGPVTGKINLTPIVTKPEATFEVS